MRTTATTMMKVAAGAAGDGPPWLGLSARRRRTSSWRGSRAGCLFVWGGVKMGGFVL